MDGRHVEVAGERLIARRLAETDRLRPGPRWVRPGGVHGAAGAGGAVAGGAGRVDAAAAVAGVAAFICCFRRLGSGWAGPRARLQSAKLFPFRFLGSTSVRDLVRHDAACVTDEGFDHVFLDSLRQIQVAPCFIAILQRWHAEDEVVHVLDVTAILTLIREAEDDRRNLHV